jgi:Protein of unknown function (DUF3991)/Toprim-like
MFQRNADDAQRELLEFRDRVPCAVVLEAAGYRLDRAQSTPDGLKYRLGKGQIIIVNHKGRGWWNPQEDRLSKGDVIQLVQHLEPGLSLGLARQRLRPLVGRLPTEQPYVRASRAPDETIDERWGRCEPLKEGSDAWRYLAGQRALPPSVLRLASAQDALRHGAYGTPCFAHRDNDGVLVGFERRGPDHRSFAKGGTKALFRVRTGDTARVRRIVVAEAPINALSFAALDPEPEATLYVATTGGIGPGSEAALEGLFAQLADGPRGRLLIATDNDAPGDRFAAYLTALADRVFLWSQRARPTGGLNDWNDVLTTGECHAAV